MAKHDSHDLQRYRQKHGLSLDVWKARGCAAYKTANLDPIQVAFADFSESQQKWAMRKGAKSDGIVMPAHGAPGLNPVPLAPQLRPDDPIKTGTKVQYHPLELPPDVVETRRLLAERDEEAREFHQAQHARRLAARAKANYAVVEEVHVENGPPVVTWRDHPFASRRPRVGSPPRGDLDKAAQKAVNRARAARVRREERGLPKARPFPRKEREMLIRDRAQRGLWPINPKTKKPLREGQVATAWERRVHILRSKEPDDHHGAAVAKRYGYDTPEKVRQLLDEANRNANARDVLMQILREANNEVVHWHDRRGKYLCTIEPTEHPDDPRYAPGKQIDVNPLAAPLFATAEIVFVVTEGKPKADAVLSDILERHGVEIVSASEARIRASVCDVPSVWQFDAYGLERFATDPTLSANLAGKLVVLMPDADWVDNPAVVTPTLLFQTVLESLQSLGGPRAVCVATPPVELFRATRGTADEIKAFDDFRGLRGSGLHDLVVVGFQLDEPALAEWQARHSWQYIDGRRIRRDAVRADVCTMRGLAFLGGELGEVCASLNMVARFTGQSPDKVGRSINERLVPLGDVEIDGSLETRRWKHRTNRYVDPNLDWDEQPIIRVVDPALRVHPLERCRLSEWVPQQQSAVRERESARAAA